MGELYMYSKCIPKMIALILWQNIYFSCWTLNTIFACEKKMGYEKQAGKTLMMELLKNSKSERLKCELKRRGENWGGEI